MRRPWLSGCPHRLASRHRKPRTTSQAQRRPGSCRAADATASPRSDTKSSPRPSISPTIPCPHSYSHNSLEPPTTSTKKAQIFRRKILLSPSNDQGPDEGSCPQVEWGTSTLPATRAWGCPEQPVRVRPLGYRAVGAPARPVPAPRRRRYSPSTGSNVVVNSWVCPVSAAR